MMITTGTATTGTITTGTMKTRRTTAGTRMAAAATTRQGQDGVGRDDGAHKHHNGGGHKMAATTIARIDKRSVAF